MTLNDTVRQIKQESVNIKLVFTYSRFKSLNEFQNFHYYLQRWTILLLLLGERADMSVHVTGCQSNGRSVKLTLLPVFVNRIFAYLATAIYR